jgi:hypothetical protein
LKNVGSYQNSKRNIEPELLRIINENSFLKYFLSNCDDELLRTSLDFIKPRKSTGSLAALDDFTSDEYQDFIRLALIEDELGYQNRTFSRNVNGSIQRNDPSNGYYKPFGRIL